MTLDEKRAARYRMLKTVYEMSNGSVLNFVLTDDLQARLEIDDDTTMNLIFYLKNEGMLDLISRDAVQLTHFGLREIEDAELHPDQPTQYFPAVNNIFITGDNRAPIQQGSHGSQQTVYLTPPQTTSLTDLIGELKTKVQAAGLPADVLSEVNADIASVEAQLKSPKPKGGVIREMLKSVGSALKDGAAKGAGEWLKSQIAGLYWW